MSFRNMLKVSFLMLLAMALAATSAHARLDLFGQLLTSKNQGDPNLDESQVQVIAIEKSYIKDDPSGLIPDKECIKICKVCACTLLPDPWTNWCIDCRAIPYKKTEAEDRALPI